MTDATDIFNNSYETEGQGVGVILRDNGKQLIILTEKNVVDKADKLSVTFVNDMMADAALSCNVNNQRAVGAGQQLLGAHHRYRKQQVTERYTD